MANHAYVIPKVLPSVEQITIDVQEIVSRKFPQFTLHLNRDTKSIGNIASWHLQYKDSGYIGLLFWLDEYNNKPCIEFRHGHCEEWLWWVEYEIREELALRYKAKVVDDGDGKKCKPQEERYDNYRDYLIRRRDVYSEPGWKEYLNQKLEMWRKDCPAAELLPLIGELIT